MEPVQNITQSITLYGAAPPPDIPANFVSLNLPNSTPPGRWLYPTTVGKEAGLAIRQFYFEKAKPSQAYMLNQQGKGKVKELSKVISSSASPLTNEVNNCVHFLQGSIDITMDEAKILARALVEQLERFGFSRDSFLPPK